MNFDYAPFLPIRWSRLTDIREASRVETLLATARAFLAIGAFLAIYVDPTEPQHYYQVAYGLLASYIVYAFAIVAVVRLRPVLRLGFPLHLIDIAWISILSVLTDGPNSPFFVFFTFLLLAAAYRWGFWETMSTGVFIGVLFGIQTFLVGEASGKLVEGHYEVNRMIMRAVYLVLSSFLLAFLAEAEKRLMDEKSLIANAMGKARAEYGLTLSIQGVLDEIRHFYDATRTVMVVEDTTTGQIYVADRFAGSESSRLHFAEIGASRKPIDLFPTAAGAWHCRWIKREQRVEIRAVDELGDPIAGSLASPPDGFRELYPCNAFFAVSISFGEDVFGRMYIFDPARSTGGPEELAFLQRMTRQVNSAVYNVYLWRRMRSKAGALERARVARELHDGVIQSLIGLEMQLDVLKHRADETRSTSPEEIGHVQELLRTEIQNVRALMNQMRPLSFNPAEMLEFMADLVDKFSRDTSVSAKFIADNDEVSLPPQVCRELVQILQEALVNVRKHSGARHVLVRFKSLSGFWDLSIEDDGRGFDFEGAMGHTELDEKHAGPVVIKERVRLIRGALEIHSRPGHGSRINIRLPKHIYA